MSAPTPNMDTACGPFADLAGVNRQCGYWPRPITVGSKACYLREWRSLIPN